jgi:hypothetical protein
MHTFRHLGGQECAEWSVRVRMRLILTPTFQTASALDPVSQHPAQAADEDVEVDDM